MMTVSALIDYFYKFVGRMQKNVKRVYCQLMHKPIAFWRCML